MKCCEQPKITAVAEALLGVVSSRGLTDGGVDNLKLITVSLVRQVYVNRQLRSEVKGKRKNLRIQPGFEPRTF